MKITLVRHGQTEQNYQNILNGRSNDLLNDGGIVICEIDQLYLTDLEINLEKYKEKKYGSTYVCFYRKK